MQASSSSAKVLTFPKPAVKVIGKTSPGCEQSRAASAISQQRLREGLDLMKSEWEAVQRRHEFLRQLWMDLAANAPVEEGPLAWDAGTGMIHSSQTSAPAATSPNAVVATAIAPVIAMPARSA